MLNVYMFYLYKYYNIKVTTMWKPVNLFMEKKVTTFFRKCTDYQYSFQLFCSTKASTINPNDSLSSVGELMAVITTAAEAAGGLSVTVSHLLVS